MLTAAFDQMNFCNDLKFRIIQNNCFVFKTSHKNCNPEGNEYHTHASNSQIYFVQYKCKTE